MTWGGEAVTYHVEHREAVYARGRGRYVHLQAAALIESTGTGILLAASTVYFVAVVGLNGDEVGGGLGIAGGAGLFASAGIAALGRRFGPVVVLMGLYVCRAVAAVAFLWVNGWWGFLCVATVVAVVEQSGPPLIQTYIAHQVRAEFRSRFMAVQRTVINVGFSVGGLITSAVSGLVDRAPFVWLFVGTAAAYLVMAGVFVVGERQLPFGRCSVSSRRSVWPLLRDRKFLAFVGCNAVLSLWMPMLNVAFPIWLIARTEIPDHVVGILFAVNTVICIVLQLPLTAAYGTPTRAWRSYTAAALLLMLASIGFAVTPQFSTQGAIGVLAASIVVLTLAELLQVGAAWTLSFHRSPEDLHASYFTVISASRALISRIGGPMLLTGCVLALGEMGWVLLAAAFAGAATVPAMLATASARGVGRRGVDLEPISTSDAADECGPTQETRGRVPCK